MRKPTLPSWSALLFVMGLAGMVPGCASGPPVGKEQPGLDRGVPPDAAPAPSTAGRDRVSPPPAGEPPTARERVPALGAGRPVRVLLAEERKEIALAGESIRAWSAAGLPVAGAAGKRTVSALAGKIRWGPGEMLDSPIDVASASGLMIEGKKIESRIRISAREGKLLAVAVVPLEEYVAAVCAREAPPSFRREALSALAVAVRTYALLSMEKPRKSTHDVTASVEDQVFNGMDNVATVFREAAASTRGEALAYRGVLARTVYHSTCGGRTETAKNAWGSDLAYLKSVACDDCLDSPSRKWEYRMSPGEGKKVARALGVRADGSIRFSIERRTSTGRADRIGISSGSVSREVAASEFRRIAGYARVKSLKMDLVAGGSGWVIKGRGYGHGVGMCQWGANGMAKNGKTTAEILERYYPGARIALAGGTS